MQDIEPRSRFPRPYRSDRHLWDVVGDDDIGRIAVWPQTADRIYFDIAKTSHLPANLPDGEHGSRVLNIGGGVSIRASGSVHLRPDGDWEVRGELYGCQYPSGRELTAKQDKRARELISRMLTEWANTHAGDIAQADDIERNNSARRLEEEIARHTNALKILRRELRRCNNGKPFTQFPELPTNRR